jgi:hypothetical protein
MDKTIDRFIDHFESDYTFLRKFRNRNRNYRITFTFSIFEFIVFELNGPFGNYSWLSNNLRSLNNLSRLILR